MVTAHPREMRMSWINLLFFLSYLVKSVCYHVTISTTTSPCQIDCRMDGSVKSTVVWVVHHIFCDLTPCILACNLSCLLSRYISQILWPNFTYTYLFCLLYSLYIPNLLPQPFCIHRVPTDCCNKYFPLCYCQCLSFWQNTMLTSLFYQTRPSRVFREPLFWIYSFRF